MFVIVPPVISSRAAVTVPLFDKSTVPSVVFILLEMIFELPEALILPVEVLRTAIPVVAEIVPPLMFTVPVDVFTNRRSCSC